MQITPSIHITTFTGKEKDEETNLSYFGARYYDADLLTGWLSMDPMADKYPSISPYAYCAWNPVKLVDPDGRRIDSISPGLKPLVERIRQDDPNLYNQLEGSSDSYRIVYGDRNNGAGGAFTYVPNASKPSEGYLEISILPSEENYEKFSQLESLAHEMRHAKQYEDKQLGFMVLNGSVSSIGYDLDDEIQCYEYADRYANINSRKNHNEWARFVKYNYPFLVDHSNQTPRPKTPLEWVNKNHNIIPELYRDPSEIVRDCNSSGRKEIPFFKIRE